MNFQEFLNVAFSPVNTVLTVLLGLSVIVLAVYDSYGIDIDGDGC
jgi:hypothetical protein